MHNSIKQNGIHYTPSRLADFLAETICCEAELNSRKQIDVLDPACGDGGLLVAFVNAIPRSARKKINLFGYEHDKDAAQAARVNLAGLGVNCIEVNEFDFLDCAGVNPQQFGKKSILDDPDPVSRNYDVVIANPPYVRTQVLGAERAQALGKRFGLSGRVDLYHAFSIAMSNVLREGGILGLLTSNRFLTIRSGINLRRFLQSEFDIKAVIDLGDTRLFSAAVLPVIVVAKKISPNQRSSLQQASFVRVYEHRQTVIDGGQNRKFDHILNAVSDKIFIGLAATEDGVFEVQRGSLLTSGKDKIWSLATPASNRWMKFVNANQFCQFDDVVKVRVGIKTTADAVFIRDEWQSVAEKIRPEKANIYPLITHHDAKRWSIDNEIYKSVFYPHEQRDGKRAPIKLSEFPKAKLYLEHHEERLRSRKYVADSGREWFEIWVPHQPNDWKKNKVVSPDISEEPTFFLDESGAIVNGDCYWMTLNEGSADDWLYLILAVANSSFIKKYYDLRFHNKLYAGRRRFMTQYVKQFPLPALERDVSQEIIRLVKKMRTLKRPASRELYEKKVDSLVEESFGLTGVCSIGPRKLVDPDGKRFVPIHPRMHS